MFKVLRGLEFKGGSSKINSLKIAVMLDDTSIKESLDAAKLLKFVDVSDDKYSLTDSGEILISETLNSQQEMLAEAILRIEAYKDIVYRMKMMSGFIKESDVSQAFYILSPDVREEIRKQILASFASFSIFAKIFEENNDKANPGYTLTKVGAAALDNAIGGKKTGKSASKASSSGSLSCGSCGKEINPDFVMCPYCGTPQKAACSNCGKDIQAGWKMCPFCGTPR
jgi:RNA polymerase subunit RPABC4/transcription elongation factor Spt4